MNTESAAQLLQVLEKTISSGKILQSFYSNFISLKMTFNILIWPFIDFIRPYTDLIRTLIGL